MNTYELISECGNRETIQVASTLEAKRCATRLGYGKRAMVSIVQLCGDRRDSWRRSVAWKIEGGKWYTY
jgi:hypothetical protein